GRGFNSAYGNRTGVLGDALGWCRGLGRTGRIASNRGRIPHLSAGVRSGSKALSYIGLAQGSTPPPLHKIGRRKAAFFVEWWRRLGCEAQRARSAPGSLRRQDAEADSAAGAGPRAQREGEGHGW